MSILNNNNNNNQPVPPAKTAANILLDITKETFNQMADSFNTGSKLFWSNKMGASPQDIANELGSNAAEIFMLHGKLGQLLAEVKPDRVAEGLAVVGNFTINEDGTVTIINNN